MPKKIHWPHNYFVPAPGTLLNPVLEGYYREFSGKNFFTYKNDINNIAIKWLSNEKHLGIVDVNFWAEPE